MKKLLLCLCLMVLSVGTTLAQSSHGEGRLPLVAKPFNQGNIHNPVPKSLFQVPDVYQEGNILSFDASIEGYTVLLLDEDENIVFSDSIAENQTSLVLPSTLVGTYELQIICDDIAFYCYTEL